MISEKEKDKLIAIACKVTGFTKKNDIATCPKCGGIRQSYFKSNSETDKYSFDYACDNCIIVLYKAMIDENPEIDV